MNRGTIRSTAFGLISQVEGSGDFSTAEMNSYADEGVRFLSTLVKWPRDKVEVQVELNTPAYTLPSDFVLLMSAYFGDVSIGGDVQPLEIMTEESLTSLNRSWLDESSQNTGVPRRIILLDRQTVVIDPKPDAASSASGKKLILTYVYSPASMANDSDEPDMPVSFHDLIPMYVQYKCYLGRLNKPELASALLKNIVDQSKLLEPVVTKEFTPLAMTWGARADSLDHDEDTGINFY